MFKKRLPLAADEMYDILLTLKVAKRLQLKIYVKKLHPNLDDKKIDEDIEKMKKDGLFYEPIEGYLSTLPNLSNVNIPAVIQFFWLYIALIDDKKMNFAAGRYPSDFVIAKDNNVYEVVVFSDNGNFKMNFLNHKREYPHETIVLIILLNMDENSFPKALKPIERHQFFSLYMDMNNINSIPDMEASKIYGGSNE